LLFVKDARLIRRFQQCASLLSAILTMFLTAPSHAQQTPAPQTQIIHAGKLIDVRTGHVTTDAYITVTHERIAAISTSAPSTTGDHAVIDLSQFTIVPGLIDAHGHILSDPTTQSSASYLLTSAPEATVRGVSNLQLWLKHGFTVVRDACESYPSYPQFALRKGVAEHLITGPRIVAAGSCVSLT
jgi:imidazolonepropionase-like amidohydrolase